VYQTVCCIGKAQGAAQSAREMAAMTSVQPEHLYITDWALEDDRAQPRLRRLAAAFGQPDPPVLSAAELVEVARERGWMANGGHRTGAIRTPGAPDILLNAFSFDDSSLQARLQRYPELRYWLLGGQSAVTLRDSRNHLRGQNAICQTALELHCAYGCVHACDYCHIGNLLNIMTNLEAMAEHFRDVVAENRWCRL